MFSLWSKIKTCLIYWEIVKSVLLCLPHFFEKMEVNLLLKKKLEKTQKRRKEMRAKQIAALKKGKSKKILVKNNY